MDDRELPLLFHARTADFQDVAVQATVTYRVADPVLTGTRLDFAIDPDTGRWRGSPLEQLGGVLTETAQQHALDLVARDSRCTEVLRDGVGGGARRGRRAAPPPTSGSPTSGSRVVEVRVVALRPEPEVERALQTPTREQVQQEADRATFERRAVAVERERAIAENELTTQIELARREEELVGQRGRERPPDRRGEGGGRARSRPRARRRATSASPRRRPPRPGSSARPRRPPRPHGWRPTATSTRRRCSAWRSRSWPATCPPSTPWCSAPRCSPRC